ncbi:hypothetical protein Ciccas_007956 [Cichlidogyrus casuarinus]|uniref:Cyclin N-terminal domain-containing protein n=1 Tax=Cichlidogyrus casuarinus TaxID=1844966 RepID=A0ABD2Q1G1_9PLAT
MSEPEGIPEFSSIIYNGENVISDTGSDSDPDTVTDNDSGTETELKSARVPVPILSISQVETLIKLAMHELIYLEEKYKLYAHFSVKKLCREFQTNTELKTFPIWVLVAILYRVIQHEMRLEKQFVLCTVTLYKLVEFIKNEAAKLIEIPDKLEKEVEVQALAKDLIKATSASGGQFAIDKKYFKNLKTHVETLVKQYQDQNQKSMVTIWIISTSFIGLLDTMNKPQNKKISVKGELRRKGFMGRRKCPNLKIQPNE